MFADQASEISRRGELNLGQLARETYPSAL